ncbi:hypothetical protein D3C78_1925730 [compost metagenome]
MPLEAKHGQGQEEKYDGNNGREGGQAEAAERAVELLPGLHNGWAPNCCWSGTGQRFG